MAHIKKDYTFAALAITLLLSIAPSMRAMEDLANVENTEETTIIIEEVESTTAAEETTTEENDISLEGVASTEAYTAATSEESVAALNGSVEEDSITIEEPTTTEESASNETQSDNTENTDSEQPQEPTEPTEEELAAQKHEQQVRAAIKTDSGNVISKLYNRVKVLSYKAVDPRVVTADVVSYEERTNLISQRLEVIASEEQLDQDLLKVYITATTDKEFLMKLANSDEFKNALDVLQDRPTVLKELNAFRATIRNSEEKQDTLNNNAKNIGITINKGVENIDTFVAAIALLANSDFADNAKAALTEQDNENLCLANKALDCIECHTKGARKDLNGKFYFVTKNVARAQKVASRLWGAVEDDYTLNEIYERAGIIESDLIVEATEEITEADTFEGDTFELPA